MNITNLVELLFERCGEDPQREGLQETPVRFIKAWDKWMSGYSVDLSAVVKTFEEAHADEMVIVRDIPIYSKCEHHLADIFGTASIGYIPTGRVLGLSKLSRIADAFARRLQTQERLTHQIGDFLWTLDGLKPRGVGVLIRARHMCMESRGICQQGHHTITNALFGVIKDQIGAREEFMRLAA